MGGIGVVDFHLCRDGCKQLPSLMDNHGIENIRQGPIRENLL